MKAWLSELDNMESNGGGCVSVFNTVMSESCGTECEKMSILVVCFNVVKEI